MMRRTYFALAKRYFICHTTVESLKYRTSISDNSDNSDTFVFNGPLNPSEIKMTGVGIVGIVGIVGNTGELVSFHE